MSVYIWYNICVCVRARVEREGPPHSQAALSSALVRFGHLRNATMYTDPAATAGTP